jgi:hypothetical protein
MESFPVFKSNNSKRFSVEFFDIAPKTQSAIRLNLLTEGIRNDFETPLHSQIRTFAQNLLSKVGRALYRHLY